MPFCLLYSVLAGVFVLLQYEMAMQLVDKGLANDDDAGVVSMEYEILVQYSKAKHIRNRMQTTMAGPE